MDITYDYYRIFYYVATYKSFSKAAKVLESNQPNVTHFMNNLENQLGCKLFVRSNRGVTLTKEGKVLYQHVAVAYAHLHEAEMKLASKEKLETGSVTISSSEIALHLCLIPVLAKFHKLYPNIRIHLLNHSTPQAIRAVKEGQADLAIVTTPVDDQRPLRVKPIMQFQEIAVGSADYTDKKEKIGVEDIAGYPIISLGKESTSYKFYSEWFSEHRIEFIPDTVVETTDQILPLIICGLGIGFLPEHYVKPLIDERKLRKIALEEQIPQRQICLLENRNYPSGITQELFKRLLLEENFDKEM